MEDTNMTNMKRLRLMQGLHLVTIANALCTDDSFICKLENGKWKGKLRDTTRMKIEELYGEPLQHLLQEAPTGSKLSKLQNG